MRDDFPDYVKRLREKLKMSKAQLAREVGVVYITVDRWEHGSSKPSLLAQRNIDRLARKAGVK